jgi:hypothetical protein
LSQKRQFFRRFFFGENILKIITSVPVQVLSANNGRIGSIELTPGDIFIFKIGFEPTPRFCIIHVALIFRHSGGPPSVAKSGHSAAIVRRTDPSLLRAENLGGGGRNFASHSTSDLRSGLEIQPPRHPASLDRSEATGIIASTLRNATFFVCAEKPASLFGLLKGEL